MGRFDRAPLVTTTFALRRPFKITLCSQRSVEHCTPLPIARAACCFTQSGWQSAARRCPRTPRVDTHRPRPARSRFPAIARGRLVALEPPVNVARGTYSRQAARFQQDLKHFTFARRDQSTNISVREEIEPRLVSSINTNWLAIRSTRKDSVGQLAHS